PAKCNSSCTVKILTRTPLSRSTVASRGRMNVVSDKFISLATDCISESVSPVPFGKTASEFPSRTRSENTSHCVTGKRRGFLPIFLQPNPGVQERSLYLALALQGRESL